MVRRSRCRQKNRSQIIPACLANVLRRLLDREIGDQRAVHASHARDVAELAHPHLQNRVEVGKDNKPNRLRVLANLGGECKHVLQRSAMFKRPLACSLDDGPISKRIAERYAKFNDAGASFNGGENDLARCGEIRVAARYVGDESGFGFEVKGHEGSIVDCRGQIAEVDVLGCGLLRPAYS